MIEGRMLSPPHRKKDPGDEDVLEDGACIKREAINCRLHILGYQLQVGISFMHNRNARGFFCYVFMQKKASVDISEVYF